MSFVIVTMLVMVSPCHMSGGSGYHVLRQRDRTGLAVNLSISQSW
jgi:hypothetical protein